MLCDIFSLSIEKVMLNRHSSHLYIFRIVPKWMANMSIKLRIVNAKLW